MTADPYRTALAGTCARAIRDHCAFTIDTFGPGERLAGTLAHLREELAEVEAAPHDLEEWVDLILLAINGATRHGHGPDAIMEGIADKVAKNMRRTWPDWRSVSEGAPIKHVRGSHD